jgi:hypothetical protein
MHDPSGKAIKGHGLLRLLVLEEKTYFTFLYTFEIFGVLDGDSSLIYSLSLTMF